MFGVGIFEMLIVGGICFLFMIAVVTVVVVMVGSKKNQKDD